jgi:hypothetical protein
MVPILNHSLFININNNIINVIIEIVIEKGLEIIVISPFFSHSSE